MGKKSKEYLEDVWDSSPICGKGIGRDSESGAD